jgi:hypothetical protein
MFQLCRVDDIFFWFYIRVGWSLYIFLLTGRTWIFFVLQPWRRGKILFWYYTDALWGIHLLWWVRDFGELMIGWESKVAPHSAPLRKNISRIRSKLEDKSRSPHHHQHRRRNGYVPVFTCRPYNIRLVFSFPPICENVVCLWRPPLSPFFVVWVVWELSTGPLMSKETFCFPFH